APASRGKTTSGQNFAHRKGGRRRKKAHEYRASLPLKSTVGANFRQSLELLLGVSAQDDLVVAAVKAIKRHGNVLGAHAEEAARAYEQVHCAAVGRDNDIFNVADFFVIFVHDVLTHHVVLHAPASNGFGARSGRVLSFHSGRSGVRGSTIGCPGCTWSGGGGCSTGSCTGSTGR